MQIGAGPIKRAGRGLDHDFGHAVAVEVIDQVLGIVRAGSDIGSQVDTPKLLSVQGVRVQQHIAGAAAKRIVLGIRGIPLEDDLVASVPVEVPDRTVVGAVEVGFVGRRAGRRGHTRRGNLQRNPQIVLWPGVHRWRQRLRLSVDDRGHLILDIWAALGVQEVGAVAHRHKRRAVTIDSVCNPCGRVEIFIAKHAPAQVNAIRHADRDQSTVQVLHVKVPTRIGGRRALVVAVVAARVARHPQCSDDHHLPGIAPKQDTQQNDGRASHHNRAPTSAVPVHEGRPVLAMKVPTLYRRGSGTSHKVPAVRSKKK